MAYDARRLLAIAAGSAEIPDRDAVVEVPAGMVETMVRSHRGVSPKLEDRYRNQLRAISGAVRRLTITADLPKSLRTWRTTQPQNIAALPLRRAAEAVFEPLLTMLDNDGDRDAAPPEPDVTPPARDPVDGKAPTVLPPSAAHVDEGVAFADRLSEKQRRLLFLMYQTFDEFGSWPTFQYVSAQAWDVLWSDPRDVYYELGELGLVRPAVLRTRPFDLREDTIVSASLDGLASIELATEDLSRFVETVRYLGGRAVQWRPSAPAVAERLVVTSQDLAAALRLSDEDPRLARLLVLLRDHAAAIWTGLSGPDDSGQWSITADVERARRFHDVSTLHEYQEAEVAIHRAHSAPLRVIMATDPAADDIDSFPSDAAPQFGPLSQLALRDAPDREPGVPAARGSNDSVPISNHTIATLASAFQHGDGPTHGTIDLIWAQADASDYLEAGSKLDRVLGGLRGLREGRPATAGHDPLPSDHAKLVDVASALASRLVAMGAIEAAAVAEALDGTDDARIDHGEGDDRRSAPPLSEPRHLSDAAPVSTAIVDDPTKVMVVHGQDSQVARALFDWLRAIGLKPREWGHLVTASGEGSPFIGKVLENAFAESQAVVVLFTPDEHTRLRDQLSDHRVEWRLQSRPNVLFEAGMAFATSPTRTVLVVVGEQDLPSDLAGRHFVRLRSAGNLQDLAGRLKQAGCPVDLSGTDWLDIDRFPARAGIQATPLKLAEHP